MRKSTRWILATALAVVLTSVSPAVAGNGKGKGSGDPGDGSSGGITPVTLTFRDALGDDRIASDTQAPYADGVDGVEAFLGSKANYGNLWLRLANSPRGLWLDFAECVGGGCSPPFAAAIVGNSALKIDADDVQADGLWGMAVGTTIYAPARVYYDLDDGRGPGFVEFNPKLGGRTPCKNKSNYLAVTRTGDRSWRVSADRTGTACVTLPGGTELAGVYLMPFELAVEAP
jgi:hypothetical protein